MAKAVTLKGSGSRSSRGPGKATVVVKAHYQRTGNVKGIKASGRYYTTRENVRGESMQRETFSEDADSMTREELYQRLEQADNEQEYHYRLVISPGTDDQAEGVDLREFTRALMDEIAHQQGREVSWVGVEHGNETAHTERAHVHAIVSTQRLIEGDELSGLRQQANMVWTEMRVTEHTLERDHNLRDDLRNLRELHQELQRDDTLERTSSRDLAQSEVGEENQREHTRSWSRSL